MEPPDIFQVALSFAGEDRDYVRAVAAALGTRSIDVFYDEENETQLWGRNLSEELPRIYGQSSSLVVIFISQAYADKAYPRLERRAALARAIEERGEYVLPARFDDTTIPGLLPTISYVDLRPRTPEELAGMIADKIVSVGGRIPIDHSNRVSDLHRRPPRIDGQLSVDVSARDGGPISGAEILAVAANGTRLSARTSNDGSAVVALPFRRLLTVYVAHSDFLPGILRDFDPVDDLTVTLERAEHTGSLIIPHGTGHIPGLAGRLNPIHDPAGRRYLYADNISVNEQVSQPVSFQIGEPLNLEDAEGHAFAVTFVDIIGNASLLMYRPGAAHGHGS